MDAYECIRTKLDVGEFSSRPVPNEVKLRVLEAARLTGSGVNKQHWRFVLVQGRENLRKLAKDATTGGWIRGSDFAVIILTDPTLPFHQLDAGRALQDMQLAAWNDGVVSRPCTGVKAKELRRDFKIPDNLDLTAVLGFGYPNRKIAGKKSRKPLEEIAFREEYGKPLAL
jgi:nitroreductase